MESSISIQLTSHLTIHERQAAEIQKSAFPCDGDRFRDKRGGLQQQALACGDNSRFFWRHKTVLFVERFAPAAKEKLEIVFDVIEAPGALAFQMIDNRLWFIDYLPAGSADAQAEIDVLDSVLVGFIESC